MRVGRFTVQVGEIRSSRSSGALAPAPAPAPAAMTRVGGSQASNGLHHRLLSTESNDGNNLHVNTQVGQKPRQRQQQHRRLHPAGGGGCTAAPRGKFNPPARLNAGPPPQRPANQPESLSQQQPGYRHETLLTSPPPAALARAGQQPPPTPRGHRQQPVLSASSNSASTGCRPPAAPPRRQQQQLRPAKRKPFVAPSKTTPSAGLPLSSAGRTTGSTVGAGSTLQPPLPAGSDQSGDGAMPPFRLTLGGDRTRKPQSSGPPVSSPHPQQPGQGQGQNSEASADSAAVAAAAAGKGGRGWPVRTVWVPNGFEDEVAYRSVFCRAMQV